MFLIFKMNKILKNIFFNSIKKNKKKCIKINRDMQKKTSKIGQIIKQYKKEN